MVSPEHKRRAVTSILKLGLCSLLRACHYLGLSRSSYLYMPKAHRDYELQLVDRIKKLSQNNPTYGYRFITELLARDGWRVNRKKVQRIRRAEGLRSHQTKKKSRRGASTTEPRNAATSNEVWSWDFIFDTTEDGQTIKILSIADGAAAGCIPVILPWEGADEIYPKEWVYENVKAAAESVKSCVSDRGEIAQFSKKHFDIKNVANRIVEILK